MNPNPTTGEQIAQQIWANALSGASREVQFKAAVNAINAAIAAEREKPARDAIALTEAHARQLSKIPVEQTYENLAWKDFQQLKQQLAVAVGALKCVDARLFRVDPDDKNDIQRIIDAALVEIGGKP